MSADGETDIVSPAVKDAVPEKPRRGPRLRVRLAETPADVERILPLFRIALAESRYAPLPFAEERIRQRMLQRLKEPKFVGIIMAERQSEEGKVELVGVLYAMAGLLPFAEGVSCAAHLFYVRPDARASRAAPLLLKAFEKWSRNRRAFEAAVHVTMGREEDARVSRLLDHYGFESAGGASHFKTL